MHLRRRFFFVVRRFAAVMLIAFALWLGLNLLFPPHRVNWPKALDQALSSSVVFLINDFLQGRVRGWFRQASEPVTGGLWTPDAQS